MGQQGRKRVAFLKRHKLGWATAHPRRGGEREHIGVHLVDRGGCWALRHGKLKHLWLHMEKMGAGNSEFEDLFEEKKRVKNPLVPIGTSYFPSYVMLLLFSASSIRIKFCYFWTWFGSIWGWYSKRKLFIVQVYLFIRWLIDWLIEESRVILIAWWYALGMQLIDVQFIFGVLKLAFKIF